MISHVLTKCSRIKKVKPASNGSDNYLSGHTATTVLRELLQRDIIIVSRLPIPKQFKAAVVSKETSMKVPGYLYLVHAEGTPRYKLGRSQDTEIRLNQLQGQSPYPLKLIALYPHEDTERQERRLHSVARDFRVFGEWFELPEYWLLNLKAWFFDEKITYAKLSKFRSEKHFESQARLKREHNFPYYVRECNLTDDEVSQMLLRLDRERARKVYQAILNYKSALKHTTPKGAKMVHYYRQIAVHLGILLPAETQHFHRVIRPFLNAKKSIMRSGEIKEVGLNETSA